MVSKVQRMNPSDIGPLHSKILDELHEGRVTPTFVANKVGESRQLVNTRLRDLVMAGHVTKLDTGLYELVEDPRPSNGDTADDTHETDESLRADLRGALSGDGQQLERRVDEVLEMYAVLQAKGRADKQTLLDAVDVEATGYASRESVWSNMVKGRDTLRALPGVETPPVGRSTWRYTGDSA